MNRSQLLAILLATTVATTAMAQLSPPQSAAQGQSDAPAVSSDAPIGPHDVIEIKVFQDPSLNTRVTVGDEGNINLPLVGKLSVTGMTPQQIELRVKSLLEARYITKADVTVQILEFGNRPISIVGAVNRPGRISTGGITLMQAITQAGGVSTNYGKTLYIIRTADNGLTERISISIEDLLINGNPDVNLPLAPGDVVNVPAETPLTIYVLGEVMKPGTVLFRSSQSPTLLQALAGAGGLTDRAAKKVTLKRLVGGVEKTLTYDYKRIIAGKEPDVVLLDSDRLIVNESVF
jgi:polysaccharide export outer membrane protein